MSASIERRAVGSSDQHFFIRNGSEHHTCATTCLLILIASAAVFLQPPQSTAALSRKDVQHIPGSDEYMGFTQDKQPPKIATTLHPSITQEAVDDYVLSFAVLRQPYKWYILGGASLISLGTFLIGELLVQLIKLRKVETELAMTRDRLRLTVEASRQIEEKLRLSEERLASIVASSMDAVIAVDQDQRIVLFNEAAAEMFGYKADKAIGTQINQFIPQRFPVQHEQGIRRFGASNITSHNNGSLSALLGIRANGQEFPIEASISSGEANGRKQFTAIIRDITERKIMEGAFNSLSGRLIEVQEEERRRIAREIHDDYNQRLAVIAVDLEELATDGGRLDIDASKKFHGLWNRVTELGEDLHALSHRLHSSTLENLGLVAGVEALCEEFAEQQEMQVVFMQENIPHSISCDVSLCIFRIVQEALRNVKRHSGADRAEVRLESNGKTLHLSVLDHGGGFDPEERSRRSGIGIRSMEERLRLLGGKLEIHSSFIEGTRIDAWLPLIVASPRMS